MARESSRGITSPMDLFKRATVALTGIFAVAFYLGWHHRLDGEGFVDVLKQMLDAVGGLLIALPVALFCFVCIAYAIRPRVK